MRPMHHPEAHRPAGEDAAGRFDVAVEQYVPGIGRGDRERPRARDRPGRSAHSEAYLFPGAERSHCAGDRRHTEQEGHTHHARRSKNARAFLKFQVTGAVPGTRADAPDVTNRR